MIRNVEPQNITRRYPWRNEIAKVVLASVEGLSACGPDVIVAEWTSEASKNKDTCVFTDKTQLRLGMWNGQ